MVTNDIFTDSYKEFEQSRLYKRLDQKFTPKAYYKRFKALRLLTLFASYLFNLFSALTASTLIYFFVFSLGTGVVISAICTFFFIVLLELFKRKTSSFFFSTLLQYRKVNLIVLIVVGISSLSVAFSYFGSKQVVKEFSETPTLLNSDTLTIQLTEELATINDQIQESNNTKWKGNTTRTGQKAIEQLSKQKAIIQSEIIRVRERSDKNNDNVLIEHKSSVQLNSNNFALVTLLLEFLFLLCAFYLEYYDYRSYAEFTKLQTSSNYNPKIVHTNDYGINNTIEQPQSDNKAIDQVQPTVMNGTDTSGTKIIIQDTTDKKAIKQAIKQVKSRISTYKYRETNNQGKPETIKKNLDKWNKELNRLEMMI